MIKDFHLFSDRDDLITGDKLTDRALFNLKGNEWKNMRSIISPTFSSGKMRSMHPIVSDCIKRLDENFEKQLTNKLVAEIEVKKMMSSLTMDVIASCAFGTKIDTYGQQKSEFLINAQKVSTQSLRTFVFLFIVTLFPKLIQWTGFTINHPNVDGFFRTAIRSIISRRKTESIKSKDYLQLILDAQNKTLDTSDDKDIVGDSSEEIYGSIGDKQNTIDKSKIDITEDDVLATSMLFIVAGYETTASLLTFLTYNLAMNDECQQKLYEEIKQFDGNYTYESISKMPYLEACIAETLRIYNPLVFVNRMAIKDYKLGDTGITLPKKTVVSANIQYIHHSPEYYPDPDRWNPERFMPYNRDKLVPYTYMPFGLGPRNCVGMRFALMETKTATAYLVNKYRFMRTDNTPDKLKFMKMQFLLKCDEFNSKGVFVFKNYNIMALLILIAIITIIGLIYYYLSRNLHFGTTVGIPGPKPLPIIGSFYKNFTKILQEVYVDNVRQYGKIYCDYIGSMPTVVISDPQLIKDIMIKDFHKFSDRDDLITGDILSDRSLFNLKGNEWKNMRSIISPTFSSGKMRSMHPIVSDCIKRLDENFEKQLTNKLVAEIEVKKMMSSLTMDVIASCAFGTKIDTYGQQKSEFLINAQKVSTQSLRTFVFLFMVTLFPKLIQWTGFTINHPNVDGFFRTAIRSIISRRKTESIKSKDYLQLILDAQNKTLDTTDDNDIVGDSSEEIYGSIGDKQNTIDKSKIDITEDDVLATSMLFIVAGYETTASLLTFLTYNLAMNDECQQKLYEEIKQFDGNYTYESISKMPYLEACIAETLRIYNPLVFVNRMAIKDYKLGDTGITLPKKTVVSANIQYIHHSPEYYPDPDRWNPERFMPYNRDKLVPYTYMPFGLGPRNCVGMRFALMETKTATAYLVNKYRFMRTDNTPDKLKFMKMQFLLKCDEFNVGIEHRL
ncbi:cytochrome P450 9e2-like [Oppia nitens]|uniref:cytochrome P450 9e2-like n=1 Tax=Oppia nitens TaxID=1686743 RepID=UPI0023DA411A|nr:cytochrome P450 9e2-like [Oppia nitens]